MCWRGATITTVTGGTVTFDGADLLAMEPEERAAAGLFLAFQAPVELPGVGNANFLRTALNALRRARGEAELDAVQFLKLARGGDQAAGDAGRHAEAQRQCRVLRRREEAQRSAADGDPAAEAGDSRRDRQRAGHRRAEDRRRRRQRPARAGFLRAGHHALSAAARPYRAGPRACAGRRPHRALRRRRSWRTSWRRTATPR